MPRIARMISTFSGREVAYFFSVARLVHKEAGVTILYAPASLDFGRVLIVTPRMVGSAPERNKIRRQIRSIFYQENVYEHLVDCAFIVRKQLLDKSFEELRQLCVVMLERVGRKKGTL